MRKRGLFQILAKLGIWKSLYLRSSLETSTNLSETTNVICKLLPGTKSGLFIVTWIQSTKLLTRANTEKVGPPPQWWSPQLPTPLSTQLPDSSQTKGPPPSPWQPVTCLMKRYVLGRSTRKSCWFQKVQEVKVLASESMISGIVWRQK